MDDDPVDGFAWYADADGDSYGDGYTATTACTQPTGYVDNVNDCNDDSDTVHPGAPEFCNHIDDDCDGEDDEGLDVSWHQDADGDGWGNWEKRLMSCAPPDGYVADNDDCDDTNAAVNPGAYEVCNGVDDDCGGGADIGRWNNENVCEE